MSKLLVILATLKAILIAASVAFARGDMLPIILISILLNLTQLGAKPIGQAVLRDPVASPPSQDRNCRLRMHATRSPAMVIDRPEILQRLADAHDWHGRSQEAEIRPI